MSTHAATRALKRTLEMTLPGSNDVHNVVVRIGLPEPDPLPGGDFRALVEISGFDEPYSRHSYGVDEQQAFLAACWIVPPILATLAPAGAKLRWLGDDDLGFGTSAATP
ncbi:hypothetical protein WMF28_38650 [Sorangium sp. So ce590]|uniref:DUF6968 family protein n=1 Tax=Sorangium sp. So ce590 TaxID=3133317 RepID=UPI003F6151B9